MTPRSPSQPGALGFWIIGGAKLATAILLAVAGFGIFRLMHSDLGEAAEKFVRRLHLDPENQLVHEAIYRVSGIDPRKMKALGAGTFFYAALELTEGIGLLLRKHWAEYLTIVATALLLVPELYELAHKVDALRVAVLVANLAVLVYLVYRLWHDRRARAGGPDPAGTSS